MRELIGKIDTAERFMADILAGTEGRGQSGTGSLGIDRQLPVIRVLAISSRTWASANFEGVQHEIRIGICGRESDVDNLERLVERDLAGGDCDVLGSVEGGPVIDVVRLDTDKTIDGCGHAASVLTFLALSLSD